jgi:hypothetical protein
MLDKEIEKNRYNNEANKVLEGNKFFSVNKLTQPLKMPLIHHYIIIPITQTTRTHYNVK